MPTKYYQLPASVCLPFCMLIIVYVCVSGHLEMHSPEKKKTITDVQALACTTFHLTCTATIYDRKIFLLSLSVIRHMGVVRSISNPINRVPPTKRAFWAVYIYRCSLSFGSQSL